MIDYTKGKIYRLEPKEEHDADDFFYGATTQPLYKRLHQHKKNKKCKSQFLFEKYGNNNIKIVLIKSFSCNNKDELDAEEAKYTSKNKRINTTTKEENPIINKEENPIINKEENPINKEEIMAY